MNARTTVTWMLAIHGFVGGSAVANPSHKAPGAALAVHGKEFSSELSKSAIRLYDDAQPKLAAAQEHAMKSAAHRIDPQDLGNVHLMATRIDRAARHLQLLGEPAGVDFERRATAIHNQVIHLIGVSKATPAGQRYVASAQQYVSRTTAARNKVLNEILKLVGQGKWESAESELLRVYDAMEPRIVFLTPQEVQPVYGPFAEVDGAIRRAMDEIRTAKADELLKKDMEEHRPGYAKILDELRNAATQAGTTGQASWKGETVDGPRLVARIAHRWQEVQASAARARGKHWAWSARTNGSSHDPTELSADGTKAADKFAIEYAAFSDEVVRIVAGLVEADANRIAADQARQFYVDYLRALAPLVRRSGAPKVKDCWETALGSFLTKNAPLGQEVAAYELGTRDLLWWRARAAQSAAAAQSEKYVALEQRFREGTVSKSDFTGLFAEQGTVMPHLMGPAPAIVSTASARLLAQKVSVRDVTRLSSESKAAISRYSGRTYANLPAPVAVSLEVDALRSDLMVSDPSPPLTLPAMQAVVSAERGEWLAAGGDVTGIYLESVVARFAALPDSAAVLLTLDELPPEKFESTALANMLMRFDIVPRWVRHDYFFVHLGADADLTAGFGPRR